METSSGPFLSAEEVGLRIGRGPDTVRRMWEAGTLPMIIFNGRRATPRDALEQWLVAQASAAMDNVKEQE